MWLRRWQYLMEILLGAGLAATAWIGANQDKILVRAAAAVATAAAFLLVRSQVRDLKHRHARLAAERTVQQQATDALALAIDARDPSGPGHARRVQAYTAEIGRLALAEDWAADERRDPGFLDRLSMAALLHDVGKLGIPDFLLSRRKELTPAERDKLQEHAVFGEMIVGRMPFPQSLARIVRAHHERWDGAGFPDHLEGVQIPLESRIILLADELDRLRILDPDGSYPSVATLTGHVLRNAGASFDPRLARLYCLHAEEIEMRLAEQELSGAIEGGAGPDLQGPSVASLGAAPRESAALYDLASTLGASTQVDEALNIAARGLLPLLPAHSCACYLADRAGARAAPRHATGPLAQVLRRRSFARDEGLVGRAFATACTVVNADPAQDLGPGVAPAARAESVLLHPLVDGQRVLGVLAFYASRAGAFRDDHVRILDTIAPKLTDALRRAQLLAETLASSMSDPLTGLPNRRFLQLELRSELVRAARLRAPLCLALLDLDGFKAVNDRWGHQAGDLVLAEVARRLRGALRGQDRLYRYAGDEFVVLMPNTSPEEARAIVERLRSRIGDAPFEVQTGATVSIGLSAGASCFPLDGADLEDLLGRADAQMYADKLARRSALCEAV